MTKWTEHIKSFASKNGLSYRDAMKDPNCKGSYKKVGSGHAGIVAGDIDLARKSRGRPKKQTSKDKEDEKLAMEVHYLKEGQGAASSAHHLEAAMEEMGNWVLPSALERANAQLSHSQPTLHSQEHIIKNANDLMTKAETTIDHITHQPKVGDITKHRRGGKMGGSLASQLRKIPKHIQLGDEKHHSEARDNLGLGANAGRHFISL